MSQNNIKTWGIVGIGAVVILVLLNSLSEGGGYGYGMYYGQGMGLGVTNPLSSILLFLIKVLWLVLVTSLVIGIAVVIKQKVLNGKSISLNLVQEVFNTKYDCPSCGAKIAPEYKFCPACKASLQNICANCGGATKDAWKYCPSCGAGSGQE